MKLIEKPQPGYIGWYVRCTCGATSELTEEGDLQTQEAADMKSEGILQWRCPHCQSFNYGSYSELKRGSTAWKKVLASKGGV